MSGPYRAFDWGDGTWYVQGPSVRDQGRGYRCENEKVAREVCDLLNRVAAYAVREAEEAAKMFRRALGGGGPGPKAGWPVVKTLPGGREVEVHYQCEKCGNRVIGSMTCRMGEKTVVDCVDCGHRQEL